MNELKSAANQELVDETTDDGIDVAYDDKFVAMRDRYEAGSLTDEDIDAIADVSVAFLREILTLFGEKSATIDEFEGDNGELILDVNNGNLAVLIGRHGRTLDALQLLVSSYLANTIHFHFPVVVDIEGYKNRRKSKLVSLAMSAAARAKRQRGAVRMAPMNSFERRIVHLALVDDVEVSTHSEGVDPERRVVVTYVRN